MRQTKRDFPRCFFVKSIIGGEIKLIVQQLLKLYRENDSLMNNANYAFPTSEINFLLLFTKINSLIYLYKFMRSIFI